MANSDSQKIFLIVNFNDQRLKAFRPDGLKTLETLKNHAFSAILEKSDNLTDNDLLQASLRITRYLPEFDDWEDISNDKQLSSGGKVCVEIVQNNLQLVMPNEVVVVPNEEDNFSDALSSTMHTPERHSDSGETAKSAVICSLASEGCTGSSVTRSKTKYLFKDSQAFDIDDIIKSCNEATKNLISLKFTEEMMGKPGSGFEEARVALVAVCGQHLLRQAYANGQEKPTSLEKARMAFSIWLRFRFYKQHKTGGFPYGKLYDPVKNGGYLENYIVNQVRNVKRKLEYSQECAASAGCVVPNKQKKKVVKTAQTKHTFNSDELAIKLRNLNRAAPDGNLVKTQEEVCQKMRDLYQYRREWIHSDKTVRPEHILSKFPCLATMPALLLSEFEQIMSDIDVTIPDMDLRWSQAVDFIIEDGMVKYRTHSMVKNLLTMFSLTNVDEAKQLSSELKGNLAMQLLPVMLRPRTFNTGKGFDKMPVIHAITHLVQHKKVCDNKPVRSLIDEAKKDKKLTQPFLLVLTPYGGEGEMATQIFLIVDYTPIEIPNASYLASIKYLFASFFVFDTDYPADALGQVYEFFEYLFGVKNNLCSKSKKAKGHSAEELYDRVMRYVQSKAEREISDDEV